MASGCDRSRSRSRSSSLHARPSSDSGISYFEQLCNSLGFENQQYVKLIDDENQKIAALKTKTQEKTDQTQRKNEEISNLDEQIKQLHKRYTWCKENLKCLENTKSIMVEHITALSKEHQVQKAKAEQEKKYYDGQLAKYSSVREDYLKKYQSFPLAIELVEKKEDLGNIQTQKENLDVLIKTLSQKKEALLDKKILSRQIVRLNQDKRQVLCAKMTLKEVNLPDFFFYMAMVKLADMKLENEIHNCFVEKTNLMERLKEKQECKDQMGHEYKQQQQQPLVKETAMDVDEVVTVDSSDSDIHKEVHQSNSVEMIAVQDEQERDDLLKVTEIQVLAEEIQIDPHPTSALPVKDKDRNVLSRQNVIEDNTSRPSDNLSDRNIPVETEKGLHNVSSNAVTQCPTFERMTQRLHQRSYLRSGVANVSIPRFSFTKSPIQPAIKPLQTKAIAPRPDRPAAVTTRPTTLLQLPRFSVPPRHPFQTKVDKPPPNVPRKARVPSPPKPRATTVYKAMPLFSIPMASKSHLSPPKPSVTTSTTTRSLPTLSMPKLSHVSPKLLSNSFTNFTSPTPTSIEKDNVLSSAQKTFSTSMFLKAHEVSPEDKFVKMPSRNQSKMAASHTSHAADQVVTLTIPNRQGDQAGKDTRPVVTSQTNPVDDDGDGETIDDNQPVFKLTHTTEALTQSSQNASSLTPGSQLSPSFNSFNTHTSDVDYSLSSSREMMDFHPFAVGNVVDSPTSQQEDEFSSHLFRHYPMELPRESQQDKGFNFTIEADKEKNETVASLLNLNPPTPTVTQSTNGGHFNFIHDFDGDAEDERRPTHSLF